MDSSLMASLQDMAPLPRQITAADQAITIKEGMEARHNKEVSSMASSPHMDKQEATSQTNSKHTQACSSSQPCKD